jgi:hypothetical protein
MDFAIQKEIYEEAFRAIQDREGKERKGRYLGEIGATKIQATRTRGT